MRNWIRARRRETPRGEPTPTAHVCDHCGVGRREAGARVPSERVAGAVVYLIEGFRDRAMCQWTLGYLAAAWLTLQLVDVLGETWAWSIMIQQQISLGLGLGIVPALIVAWYHGERGRQDVGLTEVVLLTTVLGGLAYLVFAVYPSGAGA